MRSEIQNGGEGTATAHFAMIDLIRWNKATPVLSPLKPAWKPTAILFPVPVDEIIANSSLTQNPGY